MFTTRAPGVAAVASIKQRAGKWQARVHRGSVTRSKTFLLKVDAVRWAREQDIELDRLSGGLPATGSEGFNCPTLGALIIRYKAEVTPTKKGAKQERYKLDGFLKHKLAIAKADDIKSTDIAAYRDERLQSLAGNTVKNELNLLSAVFKHAELEWGMRIKNPVKGLKRPPDGARSVRILDLKAVESLRAEALANKREDLSALIMLATQTGARLGELLSIQRADIDLELGFIRLQTSKNGEPRVLPLTPACSGAVIGTLSAGASPCLFPRPADHYKYAFSRLTKKCGVAWATFHSLRHLAVTRMLESGLSVTETSAISGHKTVHMLKRYTHHSHSHLRNQLIKGLSQQT